jgi:hypothetical protein
MPVAKKLEKRFDITGALNRIHRPSVDAHPACTCRTHAVNRLHLGVKNDRLPYSAPGETIGIVLSARLCGAADLQRTFDESLLMSGSL